MRYEVVWNGHLERVMGIEPTLFAWEARVLPLNDTREAVDYRAGLAVRCALGAPDCQKCPLAQVSRHFYGLLGF